MIAFAVIKDHVWQLMLSGGISTILGYCVGRLTK